jgi:nitroreductase
MSAVPASAPVIAGIDEVLTTTRAVRRRLDLSRPVPREVIEECVQFARQAPIAGNVERCRFVAVTQPELRREIADIYRAATERVSYKPISEAEAAADPAARAMAKVMASAADLRDHLHEVPVLVVVGSEARAPKEGTGAVASGFYGSVFPAIWSFQLALRSRGLGSSLTCIHLHEADRMAALVSLPERWTQVALLPVAYTNGLEFRAAARQLPLHDVLRWETWEA